MAPPTHAQTLASLADREQIRESLARYARGVDRGDWDLVRSTYHPDAHDVHGDYAGGIDGLIAWLDTRFSGVDNSMHFLGQSLFEFAAPDLALVETYFISRRLRPPTEEERRTVGPRDAMVREAWGRYVDRFERCADGVWRVVDRTVVIEASSGAVALGGVRHAPLPWGQRDRSDRLYQLHDEIFGARAR